MSHSNFQKHQVYLIDGKEVVLDEVKVQVSGEGEEKVREVSYLARHISLRNGKYEVGPSFIADQIQPVGRVISLPEAA